MLSTVLPDLPNVALLIEGVSTAPFSAQPKGQSAPSLKVGLTCATGWSVRTAASQGAEHPPSRIGMKQALRQAFNEVTGRLVLALTVDVVDVEGSPAVVTDTDWAAFAEDSTLELQWLRSELRDMEARMLLVCVAVRNGGVPLQDVFDLLDVGRPDRVLAVVSGQADADTLWSTVNQALISGVSTLDNLTQSLEEALPDGLIAFHGDPRARIRPSVDPTSPVAPPDLLLEEAVETATLIGTTLPGRFRLTRELARGAHGIVYAARQLSVNRLVAVKVLNSLVTEAKHYSATHFVDEIQTVGQLDHPNVIRIYQADHTPDGRLFYAMELVRGPTIETLLDEVGTLAPERAVALTRQVLSGLHAAHAAGVVHSDVKPSNVALQYSNVEESQDARAVVFDFGVARLRETNPHRGSEAIGASMGFTAPEQAFDGKVDVRSDLFAAGLLLYTMLTGWTRDSLDAMVPPLTPAAIADPHLLSVLRRALSYDPNERFESAREFLAALSGGGDGARDSDATTPPFRRLAMFSEADRWRFHGRVLATAQLTDLVVYGQVVALTGPDGAGKTSLVRAGLMPRLRDLRCQMVYVRCGDDPVADAARGLVQGERDLLRALRTWRNEGSGRVIVIFDELDMLFEPNRADELHAVFDAVGACCAEDGDGVGFVLILRQDALSMLKPLRDRLEKAPPVMRLGPLTDRGAQEALVRPFEERGITLSADVIEPLMRALHSSRQAVQWTEEPVVHAPHVQLLGSYVYTNLPEGFTGALTVEQCECALPVTTLMGRWFERAVASVRSAGVPEEIVISLIAAMVTDDGRPRARNEAELGDIDERLDRAVLDEFVAEQLLVRGTRPGLMPTWEIIHPVLMPVAQAWLAAISPDEDG